MIRTEALRVFVTVADRGNLRDAAAALFRTQSAVSMTLKQLEARLGGPLFETDRKQNLTDLGRFVHGVAAVLMRDHDHAIDLIDGYAQGRTGRLRIASVPSVASLVIPTVLQAFTLARPEAHIDLVDTHSADVRRMVATGEVDIGIASPPPASEALSATPLFEDRLKLVCRADAPLAAQAGPLEWAQLAQVALILNEAVRALPAPEYQALAARARLSVRNVTSLMAMVQAGVGVTILPGLATVSLPQNLVALPLADPVCTRTVSLLTREGRARSPLTSAFARDMAQAAPALVQRLGLMPASGVTAAP
jgi:DNA-binding transcriptional LysR family regulator